MYLQKHCGQYLLRPVTVDQSEQILLSHGWALKIQNKTFSLDVRKQLLLCSFSVFCPLDLTVYRHTDQGC